MLPLHCWWCWRAFPAAIINFCETAALFRLPLHQDWGRTRTAGDRFARDGKELEPQLRKTITHRTATLNRRDVTYELSAPVRLCEHKKEPPGGGLGWPEPAHLLAKLASPLSRSEILCVLSSRLHKSACKRAQSNSLRNPFKIPPKAVSLEIF